jgi:hypothetical protein
LQRPVKISQVFITPSVSSKMTIPALACRLTDLIEGKLGKVKGVDPGSVVTGPIDKLLIYWNVTNWSPIEMRGKRRRTQGS